MLHDDCNSWGKLSISANIFVCKPNPLRKIQIFIVPHILEFTIVIRYYRFHLKMEMSQAGVSQWLSVGLWTRRSHFRSGHMHRHMPGWRLNPQEGVQKVAERCFSFIDVSFSLSSFPSKNQQKHIFKKSKWTLIIFLHLYMWLLAAKLKSFDL